MQFFELISSCNIGRQSFITSERISNIRTMTTWQEDTGALRGKPLKYNLYGVAAVGIAVKGCVGRPLSLRSAIARPVAQFKIWIERGVTRMICIIQRFMADLGC